MSNMKYLAIAVVVTVVAAGIALTVMTSPFGALVGGVAIALSVVAAIVAITLYFMKESTLALTWREEDFRWH